MNSLKYPEPEGSIILLQSGCALLLALSLAAFVHAYGKKRAYEESILSLERRSHQLDQLEKKVENFRNIIRMYVNSDPDFKEHLWHDVEAKWEDIPFEELIYRLKAVYRPENYFVLKGFQAYAGKNKKGNGSHNSKKRGEIKNTFILKGWALCHLLDDHTSNSF